MVHAQANSLQLCFPCSNEGCPILSTRIQSYPFAFYRKTGSVVVYSSSTPLDTNRFRWKSIFSIRETLRKISLMLDEGVASRSDGVHRIHWTRIESDRKVHFLFVKDF